MAAKVLNKMRPQTCQSDRSISVKLVNQVQKCRFEITPFKVFIADYLAAPSINAVGSKRANFRNSSMKLSGNISEICNFRNMQTKSIFFKKLQFSPLNGNQ